MNPNLQGAWFLMRRAAQHSPAGLALARARQCVDVLDQAVRVTPDCRPDVVCPTDCPSCIERIYAKAHELAGPAMRQWKGAT